MWQAVVRASAEVLAARSCLTCWKGSQLSNLIKVLGGALDQDMIADASAVLGRRVGAIWCSGCNSPSIMQVVKCQVVLIMQVVDMPSVGLIMQVVDVPSVSEEDARETHAMTDNALDNETKCSQLSNLLKDLGGTAAP